MRSRNETTCSYGFSIAVLSIVLWTNVAFCQDVNPVSWSIQLKSANVVRERQFVARLKAVIEPGWHLYAIEQEPGGPKPLRITLPKDTGYQLEAVQAPPSTIEHDANFDAQTRYYETEVVFDLSVVASSSVAVGKLRKLIADVRYQVCNRQFCLSPTTVRVEADVSS